MLYQEHSAKNQAQQSEYFVQSALDALSAHIAILDDSGAIIGINDAWRRFADDNGLDDQKYSLGLNYLAICDRAQGKFSQEAPLISGGIRDVLKGNRAEFYLEYPCHSPTERRWFVVRVTRYAWDGRTRLIVAHQNVTDLKLVQVQLEDNQKRLQTILDNVVNGIVTIASTGRLESVNNAATLIFGYSPKELIGREINILFGEPYRQMPYRQILSALQSNGHHEIVGQRRNSTLFPMNFAVKEVYLGNRRIYTGIIQDITDRKQMEEELWEKERITIALEKERELRDFKNRFIGMMSHELRTPLSSIRLSADLMKLYKARMSLDEEHQYLDNINTQVDHLSDLVKEMLLVSRSEGREFDFIAMPTDLVALARQIIDEYALVLQNTHTLHLHAPDRLIAMLDPKLMRQILNNLISNAVKYSPRLSEVTVEISIENAHIVLRVIDHGMGIPDDDQKLLFEPLHRGANVINLPGTGIGLTVVKQAVELHHGTIRVQSKVGEGTTVMIALAYRTV